MEEDWERTTEFPSRARRFEPGGVANDAIGPNAPLGVEDSIPGVVDAIASQAGNPQTPSPLASVGRHRPTRAGLGRVELGWGPEDNGDPEGGYAGSRARYKLRFVH
jgi:hypothetical protein